jgi:drug/metabolite transporter (DMT)-like permease
LLLGDLNSFTLAGILYLGAGAGMTLFRLVTGDSRTTPSAHTPEWGNNQSSRRSVLALIGAIASGGVFAPALLFWGLASLTASTTSLLLSLELVFTALLARLAFREQITKNGAAVVLMVGASALLSWTGGGFSWSLSVIAVICATLFWGLDNNLTNKARRYSPAFIAQLKGLVAGSVNLAVGITLLGHVPGVRSMLAGAALGAVSYGLSLVLFVHSLRLLGATRTSAYFSSAPVLGALLSLAIFAERPSWNLVAAFVLVIVATFFMISERHVHKHNHGTLVHTHAHFPDDEHRHPH